LAGGSGEHCALALLWLSQCHLDFGSYSPHSIQRWLFLQSLGNPAMPKSMPETIANSPPIDYGENLPASNGI
jgi:hypothetical protein